MEFLHLIFYACPRLRFLDVETNPSPRHPVPDVCRQLYSNVQGLAENLSDITVASSRYDLLLCSETLISDIRDVLVHVAGCRIWAPSLVVLGARWIWSISPTQVLVWLLRNDGF